MEKAEHHARESQQRKQANARNRFGACQSVPKAQLDTHSHTGTRTSLGGFGWVSPRAWWIICFHAMASSCLLSTNKPAHESVLPSCTNRSSASSTGTQKPIVRFPGSRLRFLGEPTSTPFSGSFFSMAGGAAVRDGRRRKRKGLSPFKKCLRSPSAPSPLSCVLPFSARRFLFFALPSAKPPKPTRAVCVLFRAVRGHELVRRNRSAPHLFLSRAVARSLARSLYAVAADGKEGKEAGWRAPSLVGGID